jgi:hypothetical protein
MNQFAPGTPGTPLQARSALMAHLSRLGTIRRILITSVWFGGLVALTTWVYLGWRWALGFGGGLIVGMANLYFLSLLTQLLLMAERRSKKAIVGILAGKLIVVYGGLAALLVWDLPPPLSVAAGFSVVLLVIVLKAFGRALLDSRFFGRATRAERVGDEHGQS